MQKINKNKLYKSGFTLVELLVVISLIAILSGIAIVGLSGIQDKGKDTRRLGDLKEVQIALETYKSINSVYPDAGQQGSDAYVVGLTPNLITKLPKDPSNAHNGTAGYIYQVSQDKKTYCFSVRGTVAKPDGQKDLVDAGNAKSWKACKGKDAGNPGF